MPLQTAAGGRLLADSPYQPAVAAPPSRVTRTRVLVGFLVALVVLQSGLLVWWMSSNAWSTGAKTSSVTITSEPSGAAVVVDGAAMGATPITTAMVAGAHQLQVGNEPPQTLTVDAGASSSTHVVLARTEPTAVAKAGSVQITTNPPGAEITVDGVSRGISPVHVAGLAPGPHAVTLARAGRLLRRSVTVEAGASVPLAVAMEGTGTGPGWLTVTSPIPALIYNGDALVGRTDTPRMQLPAGRHQLVLLNDALKFREERTVDVAPGRTVSVQVEPIYGTLNINAQPWASVWVDGSAIGETPIGNYSLPIGSHEVVLRHPELGERRQTVVVGVGPSALVGVDLRR